MANIADLDILFPNENDSIEFTGKDGKKYKIPIFIPVSVGFTLIDNIDKLMSIFPSGVQGRPAFTRETLDMMQELLVSIIKEHYDHVDREWLRKNVSLVRQAYIIFKFIMPLYDFLTQSGFLETVMPKKKPTE